MVVETRLMLGEGRVVYEKPDTKGRAESESARRNMLSAANTIGELRSPR